MKIIGNLSAVLIVLNCLIAGLVQADFSTSDLTEFQCALIADWVVFDLRDLESPDDSEDQEYLATAIASNSTGTLNTLFTYQFCKYTLLTSSDTFAYMDQWWVPTDSSETDYETTQTILTDDSYSPSDYYAIIKDGADRASGISVEHTSNTQCTDSDNYKFITNVMCDSDITKKGAAEVTDVVYDTEAVTGVTSDDPCTVTMTLKHDKGCPIIDAYRIKLVFVNNEWLVGILAILMGGFMGLFGLKFLRPIAGCLVGIFIFSVTIVLSSMFGFFTTLLGIILTISIAVVGGILLGVITLYAIWVAIGVLGMLGGFFLGSLIYEMTLMQFDFVHAWGFMTLTICGVLLGVVLSFKYGKEVIVISTSLVGGFSVMRGTCMFFPNRFPSLS